MTGAALLLAGSALAAGPVFVSPHEARPLMDRGAAVLDVRGDSAWARGHLPGARPFSWTDWREGMFRSGLLTSDLESLRGALQAAGVRDDRPVLVVGAGKDGWGEEGRFFWMLEYLGHPDAHVLDGGQPAWEAARLPLSHVEDPVETGTFTVRVREELRARKDEVLAVVEGRAEAALWDTRERREYLGATPYKESRGGHLPGARHLWYHDLLAADGTLLPEAELRARLAAAGVPLDQAVIAYCTGGVRSGFAYAVLRQLGHGRVQNYDGSTWEWSQDGDLPLDKGAAKTGEAP